MERTVRDGVVVWRSALGELTIKQPEADVVVQTFTGHIGAEFTDLILEPILKVVERSGRVHQFHDWQLVTGYDTRARLELTQRQSSIRQRVSGFHLLAKDRVVRMGVAVANLVLTGFITLHESRSSFDRALARVTSEERDRKRP